MLGYFLSKWEHGNPIRVRRWMLFVMLVLTMGMMALILCIPRQQVTQLMDSWVYQLHDKSTSTADSVGWDEEEIAQTTAERPQVGQDEEERAQTTAERPQLQEMHQQHSASTLMRYVVNYPHRYNFILDEPDRCRQESPFLVLMIPVAPHNSEARRVIRQTWGNQSTVQGRTVSHYFLLGLSKGQNGREPIDEEVFAESQRHHDILQSDFLDSYDNLTIKTMLMFEWLTTHCPNTSYGMKIDSDIFLNVHNLVTLLSQAPRQLYVTGRVARGFPVIRDPKSKWFMPDYVFPERTYPTYVLGLGYTFSLDIAKSIQEASAHVRALYIEDVYVGLCLRYSGIKVTAPRGQGLFWEWMPSDTSKCHWTSVITTILGNSTQLLDKWREYESQRKSGCRELQ